MTCRGQKISKKKTSVKYGTWSMCSVKYGTSSPVFNEAMTFDVPQHIIEEVSLVVNVFHHSRCVNVERERERERSFRVCCTLSME